MQIVQQVILSWVAKRFTRCCPAAATLAQVDAAEWVRRRSVVGGTDAGPVACVNATVRCLELLQLHQLDGACHRCRCPICTAACTRDARRWTHQGLRLLVAVWHWCTLLTTP